MKIIFSVSSLLLSTAMLLIGHGMQLTILPLRASVNGMNDFLIGITASCYYLGFIVGCFAVPKLIARIGHIRCFSVLSAIMASAILCLDLSGDWPLWFFLRFLSGFAICGLYSVIESWLNSQADAKTRGQILSVYTFIVLGAMAIGQLLVNVGPIDSSVPFTLTALFLSLAIVPVGLTRGLAPAPLEVTRPSFKLLYQRSRTAFAGAILSGLIVGSFWSLGAVFARYFSESQLDVSWFMMAAIAGGALLQYPIGYLSDRVDRRYVMVFLCFAGVLTSLAVALMVNQPLFLLSLFVFGAAVMPIYAIALATAADVSEPHEFVRIGTSILLLNAISAVVAPLILGQLMTHIDPRALFWSFAVLSLVFALYVLAQTGVSREVTVEEQLPFAAVAPDMAPASFDLDPRSESLKAEPPKAI